MTLTQRVILSDEFGNRNRKTFFGKGSSFSCFCVSWQEFTESFENTNAVEIWYSSITKWSPYYMIRHCIWWLPPTYFYFNVLKGRNHTLLYLCKVPLVLFTCSSINMLMMMNWHKLNLLLPGKEVVGVELMLCSNSKSPVASTETAL